MWKTGGTGHPDAANSRRIPPITLAPATGAWTPSTAPPALWSLQPATGRASGGWPVGGPRRRGAVQAFDRKAEAERHTVEMTTALTTGTYVDPRRGAVTFGTMAEPWFDSKSGLKAKTSAGYRSLLDVVVLPRWGETPLRDITHADVQSWVHELATDPEARQRKAPKHPTADDHKGLSAARVMQAYQVLDRVLRFAMRARYISLNPADDVQLPRKLFPENTLSPMTRYARLPMLQEICGRWSTCWLWRLRYGELPRCGSVTLTWQTPTQGVTVGYRRRGHGDGGGWHQDSPDAFGAAAGVRHGLLRSRSRAVHRLSWCSAQRRKLDSPDWFALDSRRLRRCGVDGYHSARSAPHSRFSGAGVGRIRGDRAEALGPPVPHDDDDDLRPPAPRRFRQPRRRDGLRCPSSGDGLLSTGARRAITDNQRELCANVPGPM